MEKIGVGVIVNNHSNSFQIICERLANPTCYDWTICVSTQPVITTGVLGIVYRAIAPHLIHKAGYTRKTAHTGAVSLIQRSVAVVNPVNSNVGS